VIPVAEISSPHALGTETLPPDPPAGSLGYARDLGSGLRRPPNASTFSCYKRRPNFGTPESRNTFEAALERVRQQYGLCVYGYVVMPEHVHLLVSEPERGTLSQATQSLKQGVARRLALRAADSFWQARSYDFNLWSQRKFVEKLRYIHRNPVERGLVARPENWAWSSFRHYLSGEAGPVEIESQWTARRREQRGVFPTVKVRLPAENPRPSEAWTDWIRAKARFELSMLLVRTKTAGQKGAFAHDDYRM